MRKTDQGMTVFDNGDPLPLINAVERIFKEGKAKAGKSRALTWTIPFELIKKLRAAYLTAVGTMATPKEKEEIPNGD